MKPNLPSIARLTVGAAAVVGIALIATACAAATPPRASPSVGSREYAQRMLRDAQSRLSGCRAIAEHDGAGDDACADILGTVQVWQDAVDGKGYPAAWAE